MNKEKKKFTFEDWLNGEISNNDVSLLTINNAINQEKGTDEPFLPEQESKKIREAQKFAFWSAIEINLTYRIKEFKSDYDNSPYPEQFLKGEISDLQQRFDAYNSTVKRTVRKGGANYRGIDGRSYKLVTNAKEKFDDTGKTMLIGFSEWNPKKKKWIQNEVFEATLLWKMLLELKHTADNDNKGLTPEEKVKRADEIYQQNDLTRPEALKIFNKEMKLRGEEGYLNTGVLRATRNRLKKEGRL